MTDTAMPARAGLSALGRLTPGVLLAGALAAAAFQLRTLPGLGGASPYLLAILLGMALGNLLALPPEAREGTRFAMRRMLRAGIVLLGLQLTLAQVVAVGAGGLATVVLALGATFLATLAIGRAMGVGRGVATLIAAGSSICGASAIIAAKEVTDADDEDVAYAVATVTLFGTLAMLLYPLAGGLLALSPEAYGLWAGASIHEVAQVVAAGYQRGQEAGDMATVAKLTRVAMLAPVVVLLALAAARRGGRGGTGARAPMPWFVLGFLAMVGVASSGAVPAPVLDGVRPVTQALIATALAAVGLETSVARLRARGLRPLALGAASWAIIAVLSLALVFLLGAA